MWKVQFFSYDSERDADVLLGEMLLEERDGEIEATTEEVQELLRHAAYEAGTVLEADRRPFEFLKAMESQYKSVGLRATEMFEVSRR